MSDEILDVATITFSGPRFDDAGLDLDVLLELLAYRRLLIETAQELWRRENPERRRLPKGFEESIRLKVYSIDAGAAVVAIRRIVARDDSPLFYPPQRSDEIDDAAQLIDETIAAVADDRPIPERMPKSALPLIAALAENLREGEAIRIQAARSVRPAELTFDTRVRFERLLEPVDRRHFVIRDAPVVTAPAKFRPDDEYDDSAPPLWQSVIDVGADLPPEEWDRVPTGLAKNLDRYLYGSSGKEE